MERRDFIKNSGLAAAGLLIAPSLDLSGKKKPFVIILGGGLAGLSAAYRLKKENIPFVVLEARNRLGGRVLTHTLDEKEDLTCELGAEWIGKSHTKIQGLCNEFGLEMLDHQYDTHLVLNEQHFRPGQWSYETGYEKYEAARKGFLNLPEKEAMKMDKQDWWRYLNNLGVSERDLEIKELLDSTDFGESIRNVSAYSAMSEYAYSSEKNEMDYWIKGGNSQLINAMKNFIGEDSVRTGHQVEKVVQDGKKIKVYCRNGFTVSGDKMICTVPVYALHKIRWEPAFPDAQQEALNELQYARIMKTSILFNRRFWEDESFDMITDTPGQYFFHATKLQKSEKGILTSYTIGDKAYALSKMNRKQKEEMIASSLRTAFGDVMPHVDNSIAYYWGSDIHTHGAYAIYDTRQWFSVRPLLREPFRNIYFAGEHLADWQGFMEGAIETGFEAAEKII